MIKTHYGQQFKRYGEIQTRSICGRSSGTVLAIATIETGQNVAFDASQVTCKFCQRRLKIRGIEAFKALT